MNKKVALIIMDGWGITQNESSSAVFQAQTPNVDSYYTKYTHAQLLTDGEHVGLPPGQMGNSEVGHMNLGAGRIIFQELMRINNSVKNGELEQNGVLKNTFGYCIQHGKPLHIMGLISDGGVHSHLTHVIALCQYAHNQGINDIFVHCFTDGRDTDPNSAIDYIAELQEKTSNTNAKIASVIGRYYAMDRDKRWERIQKAYNLLLHGKGNRHMNAIDAIKESYKNEVTDEFIEPIVITDENGNPITTINEGDAVICANFRTDRCREITTVLTQKGMLEYDMQTLNLHYVTMTRYDETFENIEVVFEKENITNTLGETLERNGKTQLRMAETEKYPHVTFFFSGGREEEFRGEMRKVVASPKVATYDLQPEMSAFEVADHAIAISKEKKPDFICLNFANPDMVGHTGVFEAGIKACEAVDKCVGNLVNTLLEMDYDILLTADHGNAEYMINEDGSPHTAHTTNPVPLFYISNDGDKTLNNGILADIAPTVLHLMGVEIPTEMNGKVLVS